MSPARIGGIGLAAVALLAMSWCSERSWTASRDNAAVVRVSLGARPERIEVCQTQSDAELAKVAPQMRQRVVCEGASARYRLELSREGRPLTLDTLRGGGLRHDRPLYVFREFSVPPGAASYSLRLTRVDTVPTHGEMEATASTSQTALIGDRAIRDADQRRRQQASALPPDLMLRVDAVLRDGEVLLLTYDQDARALKARRGVPE